MESWDGKAAFGVTIFLQRFEDKVHNGILLKDPSRRNAFDHCPPQLLCAC